MPDKYFRNILVRLDHLRGILDQNISNQELETMRTHSISDWGTYGEEKGETSAGRHLNGVLSALEELEDQ